MRFIINEYFIPIWSYRKDKLFHTVLIAAISLIAIEFYADLIPFKKIGFWLLEKQKKELALLLFAESTQLYIWAIISNIAYILIPAVYIAFSPGMQLKEMGLKRPDKGSYALYVLMLMFMLIPVFIISFQEEFQASYPFYRYSDGGAFWWQGLSWEVLYALQFVGVEFFFRGFLIHSTKHKLGINSVYFSLLPYVMIHFSKPLPECIGSILAGFVLGHLSYKTNSIWGGVFLHIMVAMSMDFLSMWHRGLL